MEGTAISPKARQVRDYRLQRRRSVDFRERYCCAPRTPQSLPLAGRVGCRVRWCGMYKVWTHPLTRSLHIDGLEGEARLPAPLLQLHVLDFLQRDGLLADGDVAAAVVLGRVEDDTVVVHLEGRQGGAGKGSIGAACDPLGGFRGCKAAVVAAVILGRV